jgi:hypothetical protein
MEKTPHIQEKIKRKMYNCKAYIALTFRLEILFEVWLSESGSCGTLGGKGACCSCGARYPGAWDCGTPYGNHMNGTFGTMLGKGTAGPVPNI